jgi:hypothetical protein
MIDNTAKVADVYDAIAMAARHVSEQHNDSSTGTATHSIKT